MASTKQPVRPNRHRDQPHYVNHDCIRDQSTSHLSSSSSSAADITVDIDQSPSSSSTLELRSVSTIERSNPAVAAEVNVNYHHRLVCVCAFLLAAVGILSISVSGVEQIFIGERIVRDTRATDTLQSFYFYGCGYWSGSVYIVAGIVGIVSGKYRTKRLIISYLVACIVSGFAACVQCIIGVLGCVNLTRHRSNVYVNFGRYVIDNTDFPLAMNAGSATLAVVALVTSFISVCCCCNAVDRTCSSRRRLQNSSKHDMILPPTSPRDTVFDINACGPQSDDAPTFKSFTADEIPMPARLYPNLDELRVEVQVYENSLQQTLAIRDSGTPCRPTVIVTDTAADTSIYYDIDSDDRITDQCADQQCPAAVPCADYDEAEHVILSAVPVTSCQYPTSSSSSGLVPSAPPLDLLLEDSETSVESIYDELDTMHSCSSLGHD